MNHKSYGRGRERFRPISIATCVISNGLFMVRPSNDFDNIASEMGKIVEEKKRLVFVHFWRSVSLKVTYKSPNL